MRFKSSSALAIAAALLVLPLPIFAQAGETQSRQDPQSAPDPAIASHEAAKMVPATAVFTSTIDSKKTPPGSKFQVKLQNRIRLDGGPELPSGTLLVGQVVNDNTPAAGAAKLALRFTEADLKNGQTVPIKATIVGVYQVPNEISAGQYNVAGSPLGWDNKTLVTDQIDAISGVDFHSRIAGADSGVFISTRKDDIRLSPNVEVELAIAARGGNNQQSAGGN